MAMPTYVGAFDYKNNDGTPINFTDMDIYVNIGYTNFTGANTVGISVLLEDGSASTHETDQTWSSGALPAYALFDIAGSYAAYVDITDIVFIRVGVGVDGGDFEEVNLTIDTFIRDDVGGGE